jgi:hypothetical protein
MVWAAPTFLSFLQYRRPVPTSPQDELTPKINLVFLPIRQKLASLPFLQPIIVFYRSKPS